MRNSGIFVKSSDVITKQYVRQRFNFPKIAEATHFEMNREESLTNLLVVNVYGSEQGLVSTSSANSLDKPPELHRLLRIVQMLWMRQTNTPVGSCPLTLSTLHSALPRQLTREMRGGHMG